MKYYEIKSSGDTDSVMDELAQHYKPLSKLVVTGNTEATMRGTQVLTVYHRFEPIVKIEGSEEEIRRLSSWLSP